MHGKDDEEDSDCCVQMSEVLVYRREQSPSVRPQQQ